MEHGPCLDDFPIKTGISYYFPEYNQTKGSVLSQNGLMNGHLSNQNWN